MKKLKIAILASGRGTNAEAIVKASRDGILAGYADVAVMISNNSKSGLFDIAIKYEIPCLHISKRRHGKNTDLMLVTTLTNCEVDVIVLAGYMKKISREVIEVFPDKIINIHPSLLPKHGGEGMYGLKVHESVIAAKDTETGVTVHVIDHEYDKGRIIGQITRSVPEGINAKELQELVLIYEHAFYPEVLLQIAKEEIILSSE